MRRIVLLGIPIDDLTRRGAVERLQQLLRSPGQHMIATPNPEMLVEAWHHRPFWEILRHTALNVPDGIGLKCMARLFFGLSLQERVTGVDLMTAMCKLHAPIPIFLLGAQEGIAERTAQALRVLNPAVHIVGTFCGSPRPEQEEDIVRRIHASGAILLFVAFGSPAQELWIARTLSRMPMVKVAVGVGGAFDFLSGKQKRAPLWMQRIGLEWLFRLYREPSRIRRIWRAVVLFPLLVAFTRLSNSQVREIVHS